MKPIPIAAGLLATVLAVGSHAATVLSEDFADVTSLAGAGWVFTNASAPAGLSWFQGNSGVFEAQAGAPESYAAANFNSTTAASGSVDNWLISPTLTLPGAATLSFYTQASDLGYLDLLEVRFSSGSGSDTSGFTTLLGSVGSAGAATYPVGTWTLVTLSLPSVATGRVAFHYAAADASNLSYIGIDTLLVTAVPEPVSAALLALGLCAVGVACRRQGAQAFSTLA